MVGAITVSTQVLAMYPQAHLLATPAMPMALPPPMVAALLPLQCQTVSMMGIVVRVAALAVTGVWAAPPRPPTNTPL